MITKFLNPKNDFAFRKIFGTEKNKDILAHFLNDMAMFKDKPEIVGIDFLKTIQDPEIAAKKTSIVDILCKDASGRQYIVEMQVASHKGFMERAQYYAAKAYINQANVGHKYHNLREVVFLAITEFIMFPKRKAFKSDHIILEKETHDHDLTHLAFSFLELPKFNKKIHELRTIIDKWMYFFKHGEETSEADLAKIVGNDFVIAKAYEELNRFNWSEIEFNTYEQEEKHERDNRCVMESQIEVALEKGMEKGMEKGEQIGLEKGEQLKAEKIARKMLLRGTSIKDVSEDTGLTVEKVRELAES